ncbi:MAG: hypothetical protein NTU41_07620 [Chloroflexi bacterium]|nr:hypothetical protein [Chloroflexota bacterium]
METTPVYVGIDVARESLDIATTSEHATRFACDHKGMKGAVCFLKKLKPVLAVDPKTMLPKRIRCHDSKEVWRRQA